MRLNLRIFEFHANDCHTTGFNRHTESLIRSPVSDLPPGGVKQGDVPDIATLTRKNTVCTESNLYFPIGSAVIQKHDVKHFIVLLQGAQIIDLRLRNVNGFGRKTKRSGFIENFPGSESVTFMRPYLRSDESTREIDRPVRAHHDFGDQIVYDPPDLPPGMMGEAARTIIHTIPIVGSNACRRIDKSVARPRRSPGHVKQ